MVDDENFQLKTKMVKWLEENENKVDEYTDNYVLASH